MTKMASIETDGKNVVRTVTRHVVDRNVAGLTQVLRHRIIEMFCKSKNLALIRHNDDNQNCLAKKKLHIHEKRISTLAIGFKIFM